MSTTTALADTLSIPASLPDTAAQYTNGVPGNAAVIGLLEAAAEAGDNAAFAGALSCLDEAALTAAEFVQLIRLALASDRGLLARRFANQGAAAHPQHDELARFAVALAPPKYVSPQPYVNQNWQANRVWLKQHGSQYRGQWVALRDGQFFAAAPTPKQLAEVLGDLRQFFIAPVN